MKRSEQFHQVHFKKKIAIQEEKNIQYFARKKAKIKCIIIQCTLPSKSFGSLTSIPVDRQIRLDQIDQNYSIDIVNVVNQNQTILLAKYASKDCAFGVCFQKDKNVIQNKTEQIYKKTAHCDQHL